MMKWCANFWERTGPVSWHSSYNTTCNDGIPYGQWLPHFRSSSLLMYLGRQRKMAQSTIWKTCMEFLAPGFSMAQLWLLQSFGEWTSKWKIALSFSLKLSAFQINKMNLFFFLMRENNLYALSLTPTVCGIYSYYEWI